MIANSKMGKIEGLFVRDLQVNVDDRGVLIELMRDDWSDEYLNEIKMLDSMAFILMYYIKTGEMMDPEVFGIEPPDDTEDDDE